MHPNPKFTPPRSSTRRTVRLAALALLAALAIDAVAKPTAKTELCHFPPTNPENPQTIAVEEESVAEHLAHGDVLGACPPTAAELDPPTVRFDRSLFPSADLIEGVDGGPPRPLARLRSQAGRAFDFVANEVYLATDDPADLDDFQSRWASSLLSRFDLPAADPASPPTTVYLLSVDPSKARTKGLDASLAALSPRLHGQHTVSSEAALQLLALIATERERHGLRVGINALLQSQDFRDRRTEEAALGEDRTLGALSFTYTPNGFEWPYMNYVRDVPGDSEWPLDTGVAEALRVVEAAGRLGNRARVLIADGGFWPNEDFPPYQHIGPLRTINPDPEGCGSGSPPAPGSGCATHGTHVTMSGFSLPDNGFGSFGPGGAVTDLVLLQSPSVDMVTIASYISNAIPAALSLRPDFINISASIAIEGGWCFLACEPIDLLVGWLFGQGITIIAAAGNDNYDVDATDEICTLGCVEFEEVAIIPCETDHVICVGAHGMLRSERARQLNSGNFYSNYGSASDDNSVDIFAPGNLYSVDALAADEEAAAPVGDVEIVTGTSYASPFVAGVFALTKAADPTQTAAEVRDCVLGSAHTSSLTGERRRVNALGAVSCAMGGSHPWVEIRSPSSGTSFERGVENPEFIAYSEDYEDATPPSIQWTSSLEGNLGTTASGEPIRFGALGLRVGDHQICARTVDSSGRSWLDCIEIAVQDALPIVLIQQPRLGIYSLSSIIQLSGTAVDPDGTPLTDIRWLVEPTPNPGGVEPVLVATALTGEVAASGFEPGNYWVILQAWDTPDRFRSDRALITITEDPDNLPPVVTISEPARGASIQSPDGGAVTIQLVVSANDAEDGPIAFSEIEWFVRRDNLLLEPLTVNTSTFCRASDPFTGRCIDLEVTHTIELAPFESQTITEYRITPRVQDDDGNPNNEWNDSVVVFITQII